MHIPQLLKTLIYYGVRYRHWRTPYPDDPRVVKSPTGCFVRDLILQTDCRKILNLTIRHWGYVNVVTGSSMHPTLDSSRAIIYMSYAYTQREDIRLGDVVSVLNPKYDDEHTWWCKRAVAFGPSRELVYRSGMILEQIVNVNLSLILSRPSCIFTDSQYRCHPETVSLLGTTMEALKTQDSVVRWLLKLSTQK